MKPILFNTDMVRAILAGKKTVTRRVVKPHFRPGETGWQVITEKHSGKYVRIEYIDEYENETRYMSEPFRPGEILYVRETWRVRNVYGDFKYGNRAAEIEFKAGGEYAYMPITEDVINERRWRPSIHMPKEAARIFLRVKSVRAERLQAITEEEKLAEGAPRGWGQYNFGDIWDDTIKPADRATYGWEANPWVWVIEFECCERPKEAEEA